MAATIIGLIMKEYSTPYYGTSGFGTVQTTYDSCPFPIEQYTWKQAVYMEPCPARSTFPHYRWSNGISNSGVNLNLLMIGGETRTGTVGGVPNNDASELSP